MRKWLRNWLGVLGEPEIRDMQKEQDWWISKSDLRIEFINLMQEAFQEAEKPEFLEVRILCQSYFSRFLDDKAGTRIQELLEPESFIDEIVERIKRKQLAK